MSAVNLPLPNRELAVTPGSLTTMRSSYFAIVICLILGVAMTWWQGPGLWRDWQISQNPITLRSGDVQDGECSSRRGLTDCSAHLVYDYQGQSYDSYVEMAFLDFSSGDYDVWVVISGDQPELATISLGIDMLWNRLAVFGVFAALFFGGSLVTLLGAIRTAQANRALRQSGRATAIAVQIIAGDAKGYSYNDWPRGPKSRRTLQTKFAKGQEPLLIGDGTGNVYGVAAKFEHADRPVLLDRNLERLDLTEEERRVALAALAPEGEEPAQSAVAASQARSGPNIVRGLLAGGAVLVLAVVAVFAYWMFYVLRSDDAFDAVGIEINNLMPEPLNSWACTQLYARFGDERAPYGCVAADYTSWKVAPGKTKS